MQKIKANKIRNLIRSTGRQIAYVEFVKQDGTFRRMWFQGYIPERLLKGGPRAYDPDEHRLTWVRDIMLPASDCIRSIKWDNILCLSTKHRRYKVK